MPKISTAPGGAAAEGAPRLAHVCLDGALSVGEVFSSLFMHVFSPGKTPFGVQAFGFRVWAGFLGVCLNLLGGSRGHGKSIDGPFV